MDLNELPSNSRKSKEAKEQQPEKRVAPVTTPQEIPSKKGRNFVTRFLTSDLPTMLQYVKDDVIIPSVLRMFHDAITSSADVIFKTDRDEPSQKKGSIYQYASYYQGKNTAQSNYSSYKKPSDGGDYADVIFPSRGKAEEALDNLWALINRYGVARVGDLYDLAGMTPPFTSYNYGWTDISQARTVRSADGSYYTLRMPRAMPVDE